MHENALFFNIKEKPSLFLNNIRIKTMYNSSQPNSQRSRKKLSVDFSNFSQKTQEKPAFSEYFAARSSKNAKKPEAFSNFLQGFLSLEHKSQNILDILNRKWDKTLEDCLKIDYKEKFLELLTERKKNSEFTAQEIFAIFAKIQKKDEENNLLDLLQLLFVEQREIIRFYEDFVEKRSPEIFTEKPETSVKKMREKSSKKTSENSAKKNEENSFKFKENSARKTEENSWKFEENCKKNQSNFEDLQEILALLLRIFFKKYTDFTVFLENKEEILWNKRMNSLKMKFRLQKNSSELLKNLDDFEGLFSEIFEKINALFEEKKQLSSEFSALKKTLEKSFVFSRVETQEILLKPQKEFDSAKYSLDFLKNFELHYKKTSEELQKKNVELLEELTISKKNCEEKQELLNEIIRKKRLLQKNPEKQKEDKEVQINFFSNMENLQISPLLHPSNNPLSPYIQMNLNAYKLSNFFIKSLMNLIISDKIFADFQDFIEKNPIKPLKLYILEWFLMRFGNQTYAETLMKDFFACILQNSSEKERFGLWARFCGINLELFSSKNPKKVGEKDDFPLQLDENQEKSPYELLSSFYSSTQALNLYIKLAFSLKNQEKEVDFDRFSPLFPDFDEDPGLLSFETAEKLVKKAVEDENLDEHLAFEITNNFNYLVSSEKMPRMIKKVPLGSSSPKRKSSILSPQRRFGSMEISSPLQNVNNKLNSPLVNSPFGLNFKPRTNDFLFPFDLIARFLLENLARIFAQKVEVIVTSLKLQQANRKINDFFIEDYVMIVGKQFNKSNKWLMTSFMEFIAANRKHTISNVYQMVFNHAENLAKSDVGEKFFVENYEKHKEDAAEALLNHNNIGSEKVLKKKRTIPMGSSTRKLPVLEEKKERTQEEIKGVFERNYDYVNSIVVLIESYSMMKENIRKEEMGNDVLYMNHEIFRKEIQKFPQNLHLVKNNFWNKFVGYDKNELLTRVEGCWKTFRLMVDCVFSRGERKN